MRRARQRRGRRSRGTCPRLASPAWSRSLSERGVEKHVTSIFQKLRLPVAADTHRRVLAVVAFLQS
jgi:DNA-binding CsgD family transcriptional regulator